MFKKALQLDARLTEFADGCFAVGERTVADFRAIYPCIVVPHPPPYLPVPPNPPEGFATPLMELETRIREDSLFEHEVLRTMAMPLQVLGSGEVEMLGAYVPTPNLNLIRNLFKRSLATRAEDVGLRHNALGATIAADGHYGTFKMEPYLLDCYEEAMQHVCRELLGVDLDFDETESASLNQ